MLKRATEKLTAASIHDRDMQEHEKDFFKLATAKCISHTKDHNISQKCFQLQGLFQNAFSFK